MQILSRKNEIDFDLHPHTMEKVIIFPDKNDANLEDFFIKEVKHENHLVIDARRQKSYAGGIHELTYDKHRKKIIVNSKFKSSAFSLYGIALVPLIPVILSSKGVSEIAYYILFILGLVIACTIFLSIVIRQESKEVEREMLLRINFLNKRMS